MFVIDTEEKLDKYIDNLDSMQGIPILFKGLSFKDEDDLDKLWGVKLHEGSIFLDCYFYDPECEVDEDPVWNFSIRGNKAYFINCKMDKFQPEFHPYAGIGTYSLSLKNVENDRSVKFSKNLNTLHIGRSNIDRLVFEEIDNSDIIIMDSSVRSISINTLISKFKSRGVEIIGSRVNDINMRWALFNDVNVNSHTVKSILHTPNRVIAESVIFEECTMEGIDISKLKVTTSLTFSKCNMEGFSVPKEFINNSYNPYSSFSMTSCRGVEDVILPKRVHLSKLPGEIPTYRIEVE